MYLHREARRSKRMNVRLIAVRNKGNTMGRHVVDDWRTLAGLTCSMTLFLPLTAGETSLVRYLWLPQRNLDAATFILHPVLWLRVTRRVCGIMDMLPLSSFQQGCESRDGSASSCTSRSSEREK